MRRKKTGDFLNRHRKIGVANEAVVALGRLHADLDRQSLAAYGGLYDPGPGTSPGEFAGHGDGAVRTAVVNDDHFGLVGLLLKVGVDLCQADGQPKFLVVGRNNDGEQRVAGTRFAPSRHVALPSSNSSRYCRETWRLA